jgi:hypothetical protein
MKDYEITSRMNRVQDEIRKIGFCLPLTAKFGRKMALERELSQLRAENARRSYQRTVDEQKKPGGSLY